MEPRRPRSIFQVVARRPGRYWRRRSLQVLRLLIPRMSVTAASAPHSTIGSGTRWDRAVSFRKGLVAGSGENQKPASWRFRSTPTVPDATTGVDRTSVEASPEHHGDDSKPSPKLAAACKIADVRPTALRDGQNAKARRILGRRSRLTNSKATWRSAGRCNPIVSSQQSTCGYMASR